MNASLVVKDPLSCQKVLTPELVDAILAANGVEDGRMVIGYYPSLEELVETIQASHRWHKGDTFVHVARGDRYVIMYQTAPTGCDMLTITQRGVLGVIGASRVPPKDLLDRVYRGMVKGVYPAFDAAIQRAAQDYLLSFGWLAPQSPTSFRFEELWDRMNEAALEPHAANLWTPVRLTAKAA
jgi:hypothetical protein